VIAALAGLLAIAAIGAGGTGIGLDRTQRDASGYLMTSSTAYSTSTYALVSGSYQAGTSKDVFLARDLLGTVRVRVKSPRPVFVGIGRESAVNAYLANVAHAQGDTFGARSSEFRTHPGTASPASPTAQRFWSASATGTGQRTMTWSPQDGNWRIVVMNTDGSPGVSADVSVGARFPDLLTVAVAVLGAGILLLLISGGAIYVAIGPRRR
jgi:hypothetical protein